MSRVSGIRVFVVALVIGIALGSAGYVYYARDVLRPGQEGDQRYYDTLAAMMQKLAELTPAQLDPRFTDSNGNLIADAPDAALCIDPPKLTFSYVASDNPEKYHVIFQPLMDHLSQATGKPVEFMPFRTTSEEINAMASDHLLVAGFDTAGVVVAVNRAGFIPLCRIPPHNGTMQMEILVPADSSLQTPADLKGHELTLSQPTSNTGFRMPIMLLQQRFGLAPGRDYLIRVSGSQETSLAALVGKGSNRRAEAAAIASDMLSRGIAHGDLKEGDVRSIYKSDNLPSACLGYVYNLEPELAAKVRAALLDFDCKGTPIEAEFAPGNVTTLLPVDYKKDWQIVRDMDAQIIKMGQQPAQVGSGS